MRLGFNEYEALLRICAIAIPATNDPKFKASLVSATRKLEASRNSKMHITADDRKNAVRSNHKPKATQQAAA